VQHVLAMAVVLWHDNGARGPIGQMGGKARTRAASAEATRMVESMVENINGVCSCSEDNRCSHTS